MKYYKKYLGYTFILIILTTLNFNIAIAENKENGYSQITVMPVDEGYKDKSFHEFRTKLLKCIERRDKEFLIKIVDKDIKYSFGDDDSGIKRFCEEWGLNKNSDKSEIWKELRKVLVLGGRFDEEGAFIAPYVFTDFPDGEEFDSYTDYIVIDKNVKIYEKPYFESNFKSKIAGEVSYEVIKTIATYERELPDSWEEVMTAKGIKGFIERKNIRNATDYRAFFKKINGNWKMTIFIAGD